VARAILSGDMDLARSTAGTHRTAWSVAECRAVIGATKEANRRWGCGLTWQSFLYWGL
jgi:hypothetical protein